MLARIVQERNMHKTPLGALVITCAAADDITAWCVLAAVIALVKAGSLLSALFIMALALVYVLLMIKLVRPVLTRLAERQTASGRPKKSAVAAFFITLIASALAAEVIGIHALFGAFLAGAVMPADARLREAVTNKVQDVAVVLLLPLFFVYTGLRTEIGPAERRLPLGHLRRHHPGGGAGQVPGQRPGRPLRGPHLARQPQHRRPHEHPRPDGAGRAQHRLRPGHPQPADIRHDGDNGPGHHLHDRPGAEPDWAVGQ